MSRRDQQAQADANLLAKVLVAFVLGSLFGGLVAGLKVVWGCV